MILHDISKKRKNEKKCLKPSPVSIDPPFLPSVYHFPACAVFTTKYGIPVLFKRRAI